MKERRWGADTKRYFAQGTGAVLATVGLLAANDSLPAWADNGQSSHSLQADNHALGHGLDDDLAVAFLHPTEGVVLAKNTIPDNRHQAFEHALSDPALNLARTGMAATAVTVVSESQENGHFLTANKIIQLDLNTDELNSNIFSVPGAIEAVLHHESTHALVDKWYSVLAGTETSDDPTLLAKVERVRSACRAMNDSYFNEFYNQSATQLADAFYEVNVSDLAGMYPDNDIFQAAVKNYRNIMKRTADAILAHNPVASAAPVHYNKQCNTPKLLDAANAFNGLSVPIELLHDENYQLSEAQFVLDRLAAITYKCVTESGAYKELLQDDRAENFGHPYDNPTEAAASLFTTLSLNPTYIQRCLSDFDPAHAESMRAYMGAILDVSFYVQPELERVVRQDKNASAAVDWLMQSGA